MNQLFGLQHRKGMVPLSTKSSKGLKKEQISRKIYKKLIICCAFKKHFVFLQPK